MDRPLRLASRSSVAEFELTPGAFVPLPDQAAAVEFLRRFLAEGTTVAGLRQILARQRGEVGQLSEEEILAAVAALVTSGRWHVTRCAPDNAVRGPGFKKADEARTPAPRPKPAPTPDEEVYVLVAEIKTIGGTLLVNHPVRILDPDTGSAVVEQIDTDDKGVVRTTVPRNKTYRIEILDEAWDLPDQTFAMDTSQGVLHCRFVDEGGAPLARLGVEARQDDHEFQLITDEDGWIESPANLGAYELRVGDQVFQAHALLPGDVGSETTAEGEPKAGGEGEGDPATPEDGASFHYEFVVAGTGTQDQGAEEGEEQEHRLCRDADVLEGEAEGEATGGGIGDLPSHEMPDMPETPEMPEVPEVPDTPAVPDVPDVPEMPAPPDLPTPPAVPDVPDVPAAPGVPEPPASAIPEVPTDAPGAAARARQEFAA